MPYRLLAACLLLAALPGAAAQTPHAVAPRAVVMNLAAHPDDEDGLTLAYARGHDHDAAVSVVYTRGDGGQNETGPDLYERLGAIRTGETEAAARVLGTHVLFLNFYDFGFSKHAAEAFAEWSRPRTGFWDTESPRTAAGRDLVTARLVEQVRRYRPAVMFTNHDTLTVWPGAQHGQHQAVGISAVDAFRLAADPAYHPEQLALPGVALWQPSRLFVRQRARTRRTAAAVPVGDRCDATAVRPAEACADRAVAAASLHASQGFAAFAPQFRADTTYFELYASALGVPPVPPRATGLLDGLDAAPAPALPLTARIDLGDVPPLASLTAEPTEAVPGERVRLAWTPRPGTLHLPPGIAGGAEQTLDLAAGRGSFAVPAAARPTVPRFARMVERTESTPPLTYTVTDAAGGTSVVAAGYVPVEVSPRVALDLAAAPVRLVPGANRIPVAVHVYDAAIDSVAVTVTVSDARRVPVAYTVVRGAAGQSPLVATVTLPEGAAPGVYRVSAEERSVAGCGTTWERSDRPAAVLPDVAVAPGLRVGIVRSYDDTTERALTAMGAAVTEIDSLTLARGDFSAFDTVVLDIRAFLVRADLRAHRERLWAWVRQGGHVVVGYHKTAEWNPGGTSGAPASGAPAGGWTPVPLVLGRDRVVEEGAPVTVTDAATPVFSFPHAVTPADWDGWVQERGLYFPAEDTDARWLRLVRMGDAGEAGLTTGLLLAHVGRGTVVYSALGWYRQLEALTPGAWRVFANLVSLPLAP